MARLIALTIACCMAVPLAARPAQQTDTLPSDLVPGYRVPQAPQDNVVRREVMIPMRDGVRLYTVIVTKKGVSGAPILLERTPYGADAALGGAGSAMRVPAVDRPYIDDGYIRVWQDVRGRNRSEGTYSTNRPLSGPLNPTGIDHATDAYDTIDWLIGNLPETNGRVGVIGGSYDGFTALMATLSGHPALKAAVPINPMVDVWMGDDWFHNGAFRPITLNVLPLIMATKSGGVRLPTWSMDLYAHMLALGSSGAFMRYYGLDAFPAAQRFLAHPGYDRWWQGQALDRLLAARPIRTPILLVAGQYDEQDGYGAPSVFRALHPLDKDHLISLVVGPWSHMGVDGDGATLGPLHFGEDTAAHARTAIIKPFLDARLKSGAVPKPLSGVISYAPGAGWHDAPHLPRAAKPLYLGAGYTLSATAPSVGGSGRDQYVSDPAKPVPVVAGPFQLAGSDTWRTALVADQRFAGKRSDVLTYMTSPLSDPVHIFGQPQATLFAATSGTDSDFVVKLIDVYPDDTADKAMARYQLPVAMEIFRGRYLHARDTGAALTPDRIERYAFALPLADHIFARGHRIAVQIQSSWFPFHDRNPQRFVASIFNARPQDYQVATQSIFRTAAQPSAVWLPLAGESGYDGRRKRRN
jgi:putative CocE/NonD family hydrolase